MLHVRRTGLNLLQDDRLRPTPTSQHKSWAWISPLVEDWEEFADDRSGSSCRVQLTYTSCEERPRDTTWETQDIAVDTTSCCSAFV